MDNILKYLGSKSNIDEDTLQEASNLATNSDLVYQKLLSMLQPIVPPEPLVPTAPVSIPQLPINLIQ